MIIGVPKETFPGEQRVALIPGSAPMLTKAGHEVLVEAGAGENAGFLDAAFTDKGVKIFVSREELFSSAEVVLQVRSLGANPENGRSDLELLRSGQVLIGLSEPLTERWAAQELAKRGVTHFSMELIPRITRAQSMD